MQYFVQHINVRSRAPGINNCLSVSSSFVCLFCRHDSPLGNTRAISTTLLIITLIHIHLEDSSNYVAVAVDF